MFTFAAGSIIPAYAGSAGAPGVHATENTDRISVNNGKIDIEVSRSEGIILSIRKFDGKSWHDLGVTEEKAAYGEHGNDYANDPETAMYWDANADVAVVPPGLTPDKKGYYRLHAGQGHTSLIVNTPDRAEISTTADPTPLFPFAVDYRYVVFRGQSGFYAYVVLHHDKSQPEATLYQTRFVIKTVMDGTFDQWAIGDGKFLPIPQAAVVKQVTDATFQLADGTVKTKYLNSVYWAQVPVYGYTGKNLGLWMIEPSPEYHNGGPIKQGQTVHDNVLLRVLQSVHFGASPVHVESGEEWSKVYGPFFVYANQEPGSSSLWKDADAQLTHQKSLWPYTWVSSPEYSHARGDVNGHVQLSSGSAKGAWVILAPPGVDWSAQSKGYNFWTKVDASGAFHIPNVIPGDYSLHISGADQPTDFTQDSVRVTAHEKTDLGSLQWTAVTHGTRVFQLGTFDRSAGEFRNGDDARGYQMYLRYAKQFPDDVHFTVGKSSPSQDWNYAQWTLYNKDPEWKLSFDAHPSGGGQATLTVGFASSQPAHGKETDLRVSVNGTEVAQIHLPKTGTAGYRGGVQDSPYNLRVITFPESLLKDGQNTLGFRHADARPFRDFVPDPSSAVVPANGAPGQVMYDAIRLEIQK
ncbi:polysaccharide lyase family protein [Silvibacterium sp.]|uniref:polysaccharide lyase family protein n=1 Tax=Silvibacterium sp. TaxID=1964179 RepID=UPI0039E6098B